LGLGWLSGMESGGIRIRIRAREQFVFRPFGAWLSLVHPPTACAVGCILPPLRGSSFVKKASYNRGFDTAL
jgi:hypothetical protein